MIKKNKTKHDSIYKCLILYYMLCDTVPLMQVLLCISIKTIGTLERLVTK